MATLAHLLVAGKLHSYTPMLEPHEMPSRFVYFTPEARAWFEHTLMVAPSDRGKHLSPVEEADLLLTDFVIGRPMAYSLDYRKLDPLGHHVWELKTIDVRLIGWFPRKATFIAVCGRLKRELKRAGLYQPCILHTTWFRANLDLDEPRAITGVNHHDVL